MDPSTTPFSGKYNEDPVKFAHLGKPLTLDHHARHPRPHDDLSEHLVDYADMIHDHHHDIPMTFKYGLKGALVGTFYGLALGTLLKKMNSLAARKMSFYIRENTFGRLEVYRDFLLPYTLGGAVAGVGYYLFYQRFWLKDSSWPLQYDQIVGYGIYGSALTAAFVHPRLWWAGFLGGGVVGLISNHIMYGNVFTQKGREGFQIELPGLSKEERERQNVRDYIHQLGLSEPIARKSLIDL